MQDGEDLGNLAGNVMSKVDGAGGVGRIVSNALQPYDVGSAEELQKRSTTGDGLEVHHAPQSHAAEQTIPGYDRKKGPAIALPEEEHRKMNSTNQRGQVTGTPRQTMAKSARDLRNKTNAPNSAIQSLIQKSKEYYENLRKVKKK